MKIRRRNPVAFTESLSTSFLDVLSNGLGAGILLMVLIAAIPIEQKAAPVPEGPFFRGSWRLIDDPGAILLLRLIPPHGGKFDIDLRLFPEAEGSLTLDCRWPGVSSSGRVEIYGFSFAGLAAATSSDVGTPNDRSYVLWVNEPVPGPWEVAVIYSNRSDSGRGPPPNISVSSVLETPEERIEKPVEVMTFGDIKSAGNFNIPEYSSLVQDDNRVACEWL